MASSKVMASSSPANNNQTSFDHNNNNNNNSNLISMNMDDLIKNMYEDSSQSPVVDHDGWKEVVDGSNGGGCDPEMTLEDFLTKAQDVSKLKLPPAVSGGPLAVVSEYSGVVDPVICVGGGGGGGGVGSFQSVMPQKQNMQYRNVIGAGNGGRGKRKVMVEDPPVDKATQQKQRRMIKNRESAARSRERKQAYTVELESLVTQLEEEHARLLKEVDELNKERFKQLMERVTAVDEKRKPAASAVSVLRRSNSM